MTTPNEEQPLMLSLHRHGPSQFERFVIADQNTRFWTGSDWSEPNDAGEAYLYASPEIALEDMHRLLVVRHGDKPVRRFMVPVYVEIHSDGEMTPSQVQEWLAEATRVVMTPHRTTGPIPGSYGHCRIEFGELKELP